jgi:putative restriction endonuclease
MAQFPKGRSSLALQAWQILICAATERRTITYSMLGQSAGIPPPGTGIWANPLEHIVCYCIQNRMPVLTVIVVRDGTGEPGDGYRLSPGVGSVGVERENVFKHPWFTVCPPTPDELEQAYRIMHP